MVVSRHKSDDEAALQDLGKVSFLKTKFTGWTTTPIFGRWAPPVPAAPARKFSGTAAPNGAAANPPAARPAIATAIWKSGTTCSRSSIARPMGHWTPLPSKNIDTGHGPGTAVVAVRRAESTPVRDRCVQVHFPNALAKRAKQGAAASAKGPYAPSASSGAVLPHRRSRPRGHLL